MENKAKVQVKNAEFKRATESENLQPMLDALTAEGVKLMQPGGVNMVDMDTLPTSYKEDMLELLETVKQEIHNPSNLTSFFVKNENFLRLYCAIMAEEEERIDKSWEEYPAKVKEIRADYSETGKKIVQLDKELRQGFEEMAIKFAGTLALQGADDPVYEDITGGKFGEQAELIKIRYKDEL